MEIITRNLPTPIKPIPQGHLPMVEYNQTEKEAIYLWRALPDYKRNVLIQDVLDVIGQRHNIKLTHYPYDCDAIVAKDLKGTTYYLVGSWHDCRFICNGLLKG